MLHRILFFCFLIPYVRISEYCIWYGLEQSKREVERKQHQIKSGSILKKNVFPLCQLKFVAWVRYFETSCKPHKKLIFLFETCDERFRIIFTVILVPLHAHQTWWCLTDFFPAFCFIIWYIYIFCYRSSFVIIYPKCAM